MSIEQAFRTIGVQTQNVYCGRCARVQVESVAAMAYLLARARTCNLSCQCYILPCMPTFHWHGVMLKTFFNIPPKKKDKQNNAEEAAAAVCAAVERVASFVCSRVHKKKNERSRASRRR